MATKTPTIPPTTGNPKPKRRRRRSRDQLPDFLPEACEFSDDRALTDSMSVMRLVKKHLSGGKPGTFGDLWDRTSKRLDCSKKEGRKRKPGDWGLLYTSGFVLSRQSEMFSFYDSELTSPLWAEAGFGPDVNGDHRRSYSTMWRRFAELEEEECIEALEDGADELVQLAMANEPSIGRDIYYDATATHSRGLLHHDCPDKEKCKALKAKPVLTPELASPQEVKTERGKEAELAPEKFSDLREKDPKSAEPESDDKYPNYVWINGHRYGLKDPDAGVRAYAGKRSFKVWVGGLDCVATEGFTGGTLRNLHIRANETEHLAYPELKARVIKTLGGVLPETSSFDRGYCFESVFKSNTLDGIASAIHFRQPHHTIKRQDIRNLVFDEHGVARCPECGGPGHQKSGVTFTPAGSPRLTFVCADPNTVACLTEQWQLNPDDYQHGWRMLLPLSRLTPRYNALRETQQHFEKTHREQRKRYWADGADETCKLKRFGLGAQRLRAAAARFLEWFRICLRHGWIFDPGVKLNTREPRLRNGENRRLTLMRSRRWQGLDLPYGPKAYALGLAPDPGIPPPRPSPKK